MNIEKGMYVRTKKGLIDKVTSITSTGANGFISQEIAFQGDRAFNHYMYDTIKSTSYNIIDLIEEGDWLYIEIPCSLETSGILKAVIMVDYDYLIRLKESKEVQDSVKTVLTREQIEAQSFKVGE